MPLFPDYIPGSFAGPGAVASGSTAYLPPIAQPIGVAPQTAESTPTSDSNPPSPSSAIRYGNLSASLGGGQYAQGADPNQLISTPRGYTTTQEKNVVRGPYTSKDVIVDHIMPLELGGTNDLKNVQLQPIVSSYKKDLVENVSAELYKAGKIPLGLARTMMTNWNNDPLGTLPSDTVQQLLNDPTINKMIYVKDDSGNESQINLRQGIAKLQGSDYAHDIYGNPTSLTLGGFWNNLKGNWTTYLGNTVFGAIQKPLEAFNALIGGTMTGLATGSPQQGINYAKEAFNEADPSMAFHDPAFQTVTKRFMKGVSAGILNPDIQQASDPLNQDLQKFVGPLAQGAGFYAGMEGLGALGSLAAGTETLAPAAEWLNSTSMAKALSASPLASSLVRNVALMGAYNQIDMPFASSLQERANNFLDSAINAGLFTLSGSALNARLPAVVAGQKSLANMSVATLLNGFAGYVISQAQGASKQDSLANAGLFMALHGMGYYSSSFELNAQAQMQQEAGSIFQQLGEPKIPASATETTAAFNRIQLGLKQDVMNGEMNPDEAVAKFQQLLPAYHALYNSYLPLRQQVVNNLRDMTSAYVTARADNPVQDKVQAKINDSVKADAATQDFARQNQALKQQAQPTTRPIAMGDTVQFEDTGDYGTPVLASGKVQQVNSDGSIVVQSEGYQSGNPRENTLDYESSIKTLKPEDVMGHQPQTAISGLSNLTAALPTPTETPKYSKLQLPSGKISARQVTQGMSAAGYTPQEISDVLSSTTEAQAPDGQIDKGFYQARDIINNAKYQESNGNISPGFSNLTTALPPAVENPDVTTSALHDRFMTTGMASQTNSIANQNQLNVINRLEQNPDANVQVILVREPNNPADPNAVAVQAIIDGGKPIPLGYIPRQENIINNQNLPKFPNQIPFNPDTNNELFAAQMDAQGVSRLEANVQLEKAAIGQLSNQPYMILRAGPDAWDRALQIKSTPPAEDQPFVKYDNRQDYFSQVPGSAAKQTVEDVFSKMEDLVNKGDSANLVKMLNGFGNVITPQMADVIKENIDNLTYRQIVTPLNEASKNGALNDAGKKFLGQLNQFITDFSNVHGENDRNFWRMPLSQPLPVPEDTKQIVEQPKPVLPDFATIPQQGVPPTSIAAPEAPAITPEPDLEVPPVAKQVAQQTALAKPTDFNIFYNQALQAGPQAVMDGDYNNFNDNGKLGGISKRVVNKILELTNDGVDKNDPRIANLYKFYNGLTHDNLQQAAKNSTGFDDFLSRYITKAQSLDIAPFDQIEGQPVSQDQFYNTYDNKQLQQLRRRYLTLAQTPDTAKQMVMTPTASGMKIGLADIKPQDPTSWLRNKINTSDDAAKGLQLVGFSGPEDRGAKWPVSNKAPDRLQYIVDKMRGNNVFAISDQNGDINNAQGVLIPPKLQNEYLKRYYNDPATYELNNPEMLDNMQKYLGKTELNQDGKIMQVFYHDVMKVPDATADVINKRINLLDHSAIQWNAPGKMQLLFFPATELTSMVDQVFPANAAIDPAVQDQVKNKFLEDGARFMFPEDMNAINYYMGIPQETNNTKGTVVAEMPSGVFAEKGNTAALNTPLRQYMEQKYGITLQPGQIVSFTPNIKMGEQGLSSLPENPDIKTLTINKSDMRYIFEKPHDVDNQEGAFVFSNLGNFSASDAATYNGQSVPIKDYLTHLFAPAADRWLAAANDVYKNGADPNQTFGQYFGSSLEDIGYGKMTTMAARGGDILSLRRQFDTNMAKQFRETVMRNRSMDSAYLKMTPDMGFIDPQTGNRRLLAPDEIMISKELDNKWGNPDSVLTIRYPITGKLAMSKLNVLVADDYGINTLGSSNVIDNHFDSIIRKQADYDGDGLTVMKIIPKDQADQLMADGKPFDGIPEPIADHIEQQRAQYVQQNGKEPNPEMIKVGDKQISIAGAKYPKLPAADQDGLLYVMKRAAMAKQEIGSISNNKNMARMFMDNAGSPGAQQAFTVNGQYFPPQFNPDIENSIGAMVQAAVDATSKDVFGNLSDVEKNPLAAIFNTTDPKILRALSTNINNSYLAGLRLNKTTYDTLGDTSSSKGQVTPGMVAEIKKFLTTLPQDPTMQHPMQTLFTRFANFDVPKVSMTDMWNSDKYAGKQLTDTQTAPAVTPNAQKFADFFLQQQKLKSDTAAIVRKMPEGALKDDKLTTLDSYKDPNNIRNYYYAHSGDYSQADKNAISWFLATDKKTNWYWDPEFDKPLKNYPQGYNNAKGGLVERFDDLMTPEHGTAYYQARSAWIHQEMLGLPPGQTMEQAVVPPTPPQGPPDLKPALMDMNLWTNLSSNKKLRTLDNSPDTYLMEQNPSKPSRWANLAKGGQQVAWEFDKKTGGYTGRVWINGAYYTPQEAAAKFIYKPKKA